MARSSLTIIQRLVQEYLRINTSGSYLTATYLSNARYPQDYIKDEIYSADTEISQLLIKNGQDPNLIELYQTTTLADGGAIPQSWIIVSVKLSSAFLTEIDESQMDLINQTLFDKSTYNLYYTVRNGVINYPSTLVSSPTITYIDLQRNTNLKTPSGFEPAVAFLASATALMNRNDNPEQASWLMQRYQTFMASYGIPVNVPLRETNIKEKVDD